jgi:hypothetical protein
MPSKPRLFCCPTCCETKQTIVKLNRCSTCYSRILPRREHKSLATCSSCRRTRLAFYRRSLCPACYERERRQQFRCNVCGTSLLAPASFARMQICPRCWSRSRVKDEFCCPSCGATGRTRPQKGICRRCYDRGRLRYGTCAGCHQSCALEGAGELCKACRSEQERRRKGVPRMQPPESPLEREHRLLGMFAPLRRAWVVEFLEAKYRRRTPKTREEMLRALIRLDGFLTESQDVGQGQWSLVTADHIHHHLAAAGRFQLEPAKQFLKWLASRKKTREPLVRALPLRKPRSLQLRVLPVDQILECYQRWTSEDGDPREAVVGLLALMHSSPTAKFAISDLMM